MIEQIIFRVAPDASAALLARAELLNSYAPVPSVICQTRPRPADNTLVYYLDALQEVVTDGMLRSPYVLDTGDDQAALAASSKMISVRTLGATVIQPLVYGRALGVVVRGQGQSGLVASRVSEARRVLVLPDGPTMKTLLPARRHRRTDSGLTIGFIGSTNRSTRYGVSGAHLIRWVAGRSDRYARLLVAGPGVPHLEKLIADHAVSDRVILSLNFDEASDVLSDVDLFWLPQTRNRVAHVRTTGKLADYLRMDRLILTTAVGTAGSTLPASVLMPPVRLQSSQYDLELAHLTNRWHGAAEDVWQKSEEEQRGVRRLLDPERRLGLWWSSLQHWWTEPRRRTR